MNLLKQFLDYINQQCLFAPADKLLLAVSGGVDSIVLADLCKQAGFNFSIAHCNFQLRGGDSNRDEQFVKEFAATNGIAFYSKKFDTITLAAKEKKSIETMARELRYSWFYELLDAAKTPIPETEIPKFILTAHHADDNVETVLMNFFRGTGIKGMRGILPKNDKIIRPLLFLYKQEIEAYVQQQHLHYVQDVTNFESNVTRNFFRNKLLPMVQQVYPEATQNILGNIARFTEIEQLYIQTIAKHIKGLVIVRENELHIPILKLQQTKPLQTIAYEIIKNYGFTAHQTNELIALLNSDSGKYIASTTHRIIKNRNWLIISPIRSVAAAHIVIEEHTGTVEFEMGTISIAVNDNKEGSVLSSADIACIDSSKIEFPLLLRKYKAGDYFYPLGMNKKKKLARFFIDQKLSKTDKENMWVIESNKRIVWIVGQRIDNRFKILPATEKQLTISYRTSRH